MSGASLYWIPLLPLLGAVFNLFLGRVIWKGLLKSELPRGLVHAVAVGTVGFAFLIVAFKMGGPLWDAWNVWNKGGKAGNRGRDVTQEFFDAGLVIKMTGDALLLSPPFISEDKHMDELFTKVRTVLAKQ